jgi:glycosyltransferase involved in cell wall biosynthesis
MASEKHKVSVVIPTYNRAGMLREALESVLGQTLPAAEVLVVDDGSTDGTAQVVEDLARQGAPVVYLSGPHTNNRGEARNRGAAAASGDLIAFLDSDDLWKPRRLERQLEAWGLAPEAGFAFCNAQRFADTGLLGGPCLPVRADYSGYILGEILEEPRAGGSTLLVKREAFEGVGGFADLPMNEDYELTLRLAARYEASYAPEVLVLVREHPGRVSLQHGAKPLVEYIDIVEGFTARNPLPTGVRARARTGLANVHLKLARLYLEGGDRQAARRHIVSVMRLRPWDRRWPSVFLRCLSPAGAGPNKRDPLGRHQ